MATSANIFFGNAGTRIPVYNSGASSVGTSADVVSAALSRASVSGEDVIRVACPVAMYVAWGTAPDASVTTARVFVGAEQVFEIANVPPGTKVAVLNA